MSGTLRCIGSIGKLAFGNDLRRWHNPYDVDLYCIGGQEGDKYKYLVIKVTDEGCMENYMKGKKPDDCLVSMLLVDYKKAYYKDLHAYMGWAREWIDRCKHNQKEQAGFFFTMIDDAYATISHDSIRPITKEKFFSVEVDEYYEQRGDIAYLQDREFFIFGNQIVKRALSAAVFLQLFREEKSRLTEADLKSLDLSSIKDRKSMNDMFAGLSGIESLDLSGLNTQGVTSMTSMFANCSKLKKIDVSGFDTRMVTDMNYMFAGCESLEELDLSGFRFDRVKDMARMFSDCKNLRRVILPHSILYAGEILHDTGRTRQEMYSSWSGAHSPSQADFAGTLCYENVPVKERVPFRKATEAERRKYLGLGKDTDIQIR